MNKKTVMQAHTLCRIYFMITVSYCILYTGTSIKDIVIKGAWFNEWYKIGVRVCVCVGGGGVIYVTD